MFGQQDGGDIAFGKYRIIHSDILKEERTLLVSLPNDYEHSTLSYPVLYLLYGDQIKGYFAEAVNIVDRLSNAGDIPPFIIVGVANIDRYRDCLPLQSNGKPGGAGKFLKFFEDELIPFIQANYRTKQFNLLAGPQAGAAFGLYSMIENSSAFNAYIVTNPFWIEYTRKFFLDRTENSLKSGRFPKKFLFISYWDNEGWQNQKDAVEALDKFSGLFQEYNDYSPFLNHITNNKDFIPPIGLKEGLRRFFQKYSPPNYSDLNTLSGIQKYYRTLSQEYGYDIDVPEMLLTRISDDLQSSANLIEVKKILNFILTDNASSLNALSRMANLCRILGDYDNAISYYEKFLRLRKEPFLEQQLQTLLKFKKESAVYVLESMMNAEGSEGMMRKYHELKNDPTNKRIFDESEFNAWGYRLLQRGDIKNAIEVFKLNVELYPNSANAFDSLGEAYLKQGDKINATKNYKKSLELNPESENAKRMLDKLESK
jgi:predicted alpha/beta superfamily hydrolase